MRKIIDIEKQNNFKVPEAYFDTFEKEIVENVQNYKSGDEKTSIIQVLRPYIYMAACVVGMLVIINLGMYVIEPKTKMPDSAAIEENIYIGKDELINYLYEDDVVFYEYISELYNGVENQIDSEHIENYLTQYYIEYEFFHE
ncbi:hypothetical protein LJC11_01140 [Bacteroidales bacterium OttesenSCG-928-I21]|nr:hypothetical protein [Bacteroidales bacterium OttesenSCG-928-I21]